METEVLVRLHATYEDTSYWRGRFVMGPDATQYPAGFMGAFTDMLARTNETAQLHHEPLMDALRAIVAAPGFHRVVIEHALSFPGAYLATASVDVDIQRRMYVVRLHFNLGVYRGQQAADNSTSTPPHPPPAEAAPSATSATPVVASKPTRRLFRR